MRVAVIGGGAAGMMAAIAAAKASAEVTLFEHNDKLGKKMFITGKGRCNFTNVDTDVEFLEHVVSNPKFLYSALRGLDSAAVMEFFSTQGLVCNIEHGGRVFPRSNKSSDVIKILQKAMEDVGVTIQLNTNVTALHVVDGVMDGVVIGGINQPFDRVIVATGGLSYTETGSTGDGYRMAKATGHEIVTLRAALTPIILRGTITAEGLSLKNVRLSVKRGDKVLASEFGEMLFTKNGISGPIVLTVSSHINREDLNGCVASIDLKPALSEEQLNDRIIRDFDKFANKDYRNSLDELLPKSLIAEVIARSGIPPDKKVNQITATERKFILALLKDLWYPIAKLDSLEHAIVTAGGVSTKDINPATMESKRMKNLYFAGEVLDVDAVTGGYNMQIAFCTGYLAGTKCMEA